LVFRIAETRADVRLKERVFCDLFDDVVIYVNSISPEKRVMHDVFIVDRRDASVTNTIVAREGRIIRHAHSRSMTLHFIDGTVLVMDRDLDSTRSIRFQSYDLTIDLDDVLPSFSVRKKAPKEMFLGELIRGLKAEPPGTLKHNELAVELMERLTIPVAVFFMGLLGVPLGAQMKSTGRSFGIGLGMGVFLLYSLCFMGMRSLCETGVLSPYVGMWLPSFFLVICFAWSASRAASDLPMISLDRLRFILSSGRVVE
jgi:lipopolysaccharide export system permease protein